MIQSEHSNVRIRHLMLSRVAIVTMLLGIATFVEIKGEEFLPEISLFSFYVVVIAAYILSVIYYLVLHLTPNLKVTLYVQAFCDVLLITGLVYATAGIQSIYAVFYTIVIIYTVIFLGRRGGLIIASASGILYGGLLDLEYYKILIPYYAVLQDLSYSAGYVFSRIIIYFFSFYLVAILASFVVERERKTRFLLEEKVTAFDQLDQLHRSIIHSIDAGIVSIDLLGQIKSFNRAAEDITGYGQREVRGRNVVDIFPEYAGLHERLNRLYASDSHKNRVEMTIQNKSTQPLILGCSLSVLKDNQGKRIGDLLVFQDMTEIKKMESRLETNRRLAFVGEMAAGLAHEMRNPLASIGGSIQMLHKSLPLNASDERLMQIILRGKDQLESFMKDFLLLSRPTPGVHEAFDLNEIIDDVLDAVRYVPDWHGKIEMVRSVTDRLDVFASKAEIRQLIWNLVMNALQAMPDGGSLIVAARPATLHESTQALEIEVTDTGKGIAENDLTKIFEPFFTTKEKGTGLGLAIVNRIVDSYQGSVAVKSDPGRGTTFFVRLPNKHQRGVMDPSFHDSPSDKR
jgi:two-component system sensor histidine kinase PilS (NtrC family)